MTVIRSGEATEAITPGHDTGIAIHHAIDRLLEAKSILGSLAATVEQWRAGFGQADSLSHLARAMREGLIMLEMANRCADAIREVAAQHIEQLVFQTMGGIAHEVADEVALRALAADIRAFQPMVDGARDVGLYVAGALTFAAGQFARIAVLRTSDGFEVNRVSSEDAWARASGSLADAICAARNVWEHFST